MAPWFNFEDGSELEIGGREESHEHPTSTGEAQGEPGRLKVRTPGEKSVEWSTVKQWRPFYLMHLELRI